MRTRGFFTLWSLGFGWILYCSIANQAESAANSAAGTRRMAELLESITRATDPMQNQFASPERIKVLSQLAVNTKDAGDLLSLQIALGQEYLNAGQPEQALQAFEKVEQMFRKSPIAAGSRNLSLLNIYRATCYLWQGEKDNCLSHHRPGDCVFPIGPAAIQQNQSATRKAIEVLTNHLARFASDHRAVWLLNLACMQVGDYPDKVPPRWRIDPKRFEPEYNIKRFPDIAPALGLDVDDLAGGCIVEDFDGDGLLDIMASSWDPRGQLRLFRNQGDGWFREITEAAGLIGEVGGLNIMQTDYNNDGYPDVWILRGAWWGKTGHYPNSLLRNNGDGTFTDVTEAAGLLSFHPTQTSVWFDFNNDGWLDVFIGNESAGQEVHPCELYRNNGNGTFIECAARAGVAVVGFVKGVAAGDFNNDGQPDLYLSIRGGPNILFRNDGPRGADKSATADWKFTDVSAAAGVLEPIESFPTWFWDYDNDGWLDIYVSDYQIGKLKDLAADYMGQPHKAEHPRLYHNNHDGTFTDVSRQFNLDKVLYAMGANFGDLDNDGWLDFYVGTGDPDFSTIIPNRMFRNAEGKRFQEVTASGGFGHLHKGHAIAFGDLDNDGDQDIYAVMGGAYPGDHFYNALFENPGHGNHWITLKLEGVKSNRAAIGAWIKVIVETADGERGIFRTVSTGGSFGANPLRQEIGLGAAKSIRAVEITWPASGQKQLFPRLAMDQFYRIREGDVAAMPWKLKSFRLKGSKRVPRRKQPTGASDEA